jgi:DNA-binding NtrC family response regulator
MAPGGDDDDDLQEDQLSTFYVTRFDPTPAPEASFLVTVVSGPDRGASCVVDGSSPSRVLVGTSLSCDIRLSDRQASRRHLTLELEGARLHVVDVGSTNGTWAGSIAIRDAWLSGGETLQVGATVLRFDRGPKPQEQRLPTDTHFEGVLGVSREMRRLFPLLQRLAASTVPVVIEGETGTGKEALAEAVHSAGPRKNGPFVVFDCTAVPPNLVESELFGHERGAFTGAIATRKGVFEQAHGGTLLIDEIGDLDPALQPKLLRALERSEIRRVGSDKWQHVDVRVLAATRRDLDQEVQAGRFRDDLFHRLAVARVELPPLRKRRGDVALLVGHFCRELGGDPSRIPQRVLAAWEQQPWPGNVRELRNAVARYLALGELAQLQQAEESAPDSLPAMPTPGTDWLEPILAQKLPLAEAREKVLQVFERRYIEAMLAAFGGNGVRAAAAAGVARRYFQLLKAKRGAGG